LQIPANQTESASRILMIDDDVKLCRLIRDYLQPLGYCVTIAHTGRDGLTIAATDTFAAIILDVMLPGMNGLEVLRQLRETSMTPVLMLTGRGDEPDRIVGLELGADDYLPKTFSTRELLARLRAVIRRSSIAAQAREEQRHSVITVDDLSINTGSRSAELAGAPLQLTAVEFDILTSLARAAGL
jgi:DNA-binding response OmpR family regulator